MNSVQIKLNARTYNLKFGLKCVRILGQLWGVPTMQGVLNRLSILDAMTKSSDFDLEGLDVLESVVIAAIKSDSTNDIDEADFDLVLDYMYANAEKMTEVFQSLLDSMPVQDVEQGKQKNQVKKKK